MSANSVPEDVISPVLVAGGTGRLGTQLVRRFLARGLSVKVLTRDRAHAAHLPTDRVELVLGDVRDRQAVERSTTGAKTVVSAIYGFAATDDSTPETVDHQGNRHLIEAAKHNGVTHFVLLSIVGAAPNHPVALFRMKYQAEQELRASGLNWSIVRATAYMETWAALIGEPLIGTGKTRLFGQGSNPINFVSVYDVAQFVELCVTDSAQQGRSLDVGGPENLTMKQFVSVFEVATGKMGAVSTVPLPVMRLMGAVMRLVNPKLAEQIQAGIAMDTRDMTFDPSSLRNRYPSIKLTNFADMVKRDYGAAV